MHIDPDFFLQQNFLEEFWQQTIFHGRLPDQGCDNSCSSHSLSLAEQSPYILTTVLAGLQCILPVLFQIWSQETDTLLIVSGERVVSEHF